jgi:hypothetical protein
VDFVGQMSEVGGEDGECQFDHLKVRSLYGSLSAPMDLVLSAVFATDGGVTEARGNLTRVQGGVDSIW